MQLRRVIPVARRLFPGADLGSGPQTSMDDRFVVDCPYCGEQVDIYVEPDLRGSFIQDCEVCCNPWTLRVVRDGAERYLDVRRADGSE